MKDEIRRRCRIREYHEISLLASGAEKEEYLLTEHRFTVHGLPLNPGPGVNPYFPVPLSIDTIDVEATPFLINAFREKQEIEVIFRPAEPHAEPEVPILRYGDDAVEATMRHRREHSTAVVSLEHPGNVPGLTGEQQRQAVQLLRRIVGCDEAEGNTMVLHNAEGFYNEVAVLVKSIDAESI